jgi:hypothetical protein
VNFICGDHHQIPLASEYEAAGSFFVLDCMKQEEAILFAKIVASHLKPGGLWLFADFFRTKNIFKKDYCGSCIASSGLLPAWWQADFLIMILFFITQD